MTGDTRTDILALGARWAEAEGTACRGPSRHLS